MDNHVRQEIIRLSKAMQLGCLCGSATHASMPTHPAPHPPTHVTLRGGQLHPRKWYVFDAPSTSWLRVGTDSFKINASFPKELMIEMNLGTITDQPRCEPTWHPAAKTMSGKS
eukprot:1159345-Pelagomonas_calceolata.AAC.5